MITATAGFLRLIIYAPNSSATSGNVFHKIPIGCGKQRQVKLHIIVVPVLRASNKKWWYIYIYIYIYSQWKKRNLVVRGGLKNNRFSHVEVYYMFNLWFPIAQPTADHRVERKKPAHISRLVISVSWHYEADHQRLQSADCFMLTISRLVCAPKSAGVCIYSVRLRKLCKICNICVCMI